MTLEYEEIYSQFYLNMTDSSFYKLQKEQVYDMMKCWLHNAASVPYIRKIFSILRFDDVLMCITYELNNSVNADLDHDFVINVFSQYMVIAWMQPQIDSAVNLAIVIGGKEEKKLQSNYSASITRLENLRTSLRKMIRDYGYVNNDYIKEES